MIPPEHAKEIIKMCEEKGLSRKETELVLIAANICVMRIVDLAVEENGKDRTNNSYVPVG